MRLEKRLRALFSGYQEKLARRSKGAEAGVQSAVSVSGEEAIVIRKARLEDLDEVIKVNEVALPEHYPRWFWENHLLLWGEAFYVAVDANGKIVGYVMSRAEYGQGFVVPGFVTKGHIISIAVLPEYRRRGIGSSLLQRAMESLRDKYRCSEVYLEVRVSNTPAIKLYEKHGFRVVKRLPNYYIDGEDAYLMARSLLDEEDQSPQQPSA